MRKLSMLEKVLMSRDGMSIEEARDEQKRLLKDMVDIVNDGGDWEAVNSYFVSEVALEPDYWEEILLPALWMLDARRQASA